MLVRNIVIIVILVFIAGTGCGHYYTFKSDPGEANVYLNDTLVGKTPLEVPTGDLPPTDNIRVRITKDGYTSFQGIIPSPSISTMRADIAVSLNKGEDETDKVNRQIGYIINAQKLVMVKKYDDALKLAEKAIQENPRYVYAQLLKGSILFLNHSYTPALAQFQKVLEFDPTNTEAIRMINYLKTTGGVGPENSANRLPANTTRKAETRGGP